MKKLYTMLLLVISLCTASCSDWLDVSCLLYTSDAADEL